VTPRQQAEAIVGSLGLVGLSNSEANAEADRLVAEITEAIERACREGMTGATAIVRAAFIKRGLLPVEG
jgi:fumarate hydratase class II